MSKYQNQLFCVVENYYKHIEAIQSENPSISDMAKKLCNIDILSMWMLTQELM